MSGDEEVDELLEEEIDDLKGESRRKRKQEAQEGPDDDFSTETEVDEDIEDSDEGSDGSYKAKLSLKKKKQGKKKLVRPLQSIYTCEKCSGHFSTSQALGSHLLQCGKLLPATRVRQTMILNPPHLLCKSSRLSEYNQRLLQTVELFVSTAEDVQVQHRGNGARKIVDGQVGIRCMACAQRGSATSAWCRYPGSLKVFPHNIYVLMEKHALQCTAVSGERIIKLKELKKKTTSQSMRKGALGLPVYLKEIYEYYQMEDAPQGGVQLKTSASTTRVGVVLDI